MTDHPFAMWNDYAARIARQHNVALADISAEDERRAAFDAGLSPDAYVKLALEREGITMNGPAPERAADEAAPEDVARKHEEMRALVKQLIVSSLMGADGNPIVALAALLKSAMLIVESAPDESREICVRLFEEAMLALPARG